MYIRFAAILLAVLQPFLLIIFEGELKSISSYWETSFQPLFIFVNAATSYFLFATEKWRLPSFFLLSLTAFSVELYPQVHNLLAVSFFISAAISLKRCKRFGFYFYPYLISPLFLFHSILLTEIYCVLILCGYHTHMLIYTHSLKNRN
jgi:hypothetical protein